MFLASFSLCRREIVRFLRQPNRVIGALATPLMFWLLIGAGVGRSFSGSTAGIGGGMQQDYLRYFFPGTILMIVLFTAIFSTISIIEDRREGFLQSVLVAPIGRGSIVLGKVLGGTLLASGQAILFLLLSPFIGVTWTLSSALVALIAVLLLSFALTALGFCIAWRMSSTQGFHAIMNLFLMPLWFLSGALFPPSGAMGGIRYVMQANPLTYGLAAIRRAVFSQSPAVLAGLPSLTLCLVVTLAFSAGIFLLASWVARGRVAADLQ